MIRMRTVTSSVSVTTLELLHKFPSVSVLHSRPRTSTRWPHPHLGTSLSLAPSDQFRTETTFILTTILWLIVDLTDSFAFFDVTLNSSMMFSSLFAVVQSSEPHCPPRLAWAAMTTCSSASPPHLPFLSLTSCSCTPCNSSVPVLCRALSLGTSSGCAVNPSAPSGHELSTSLAYVYTRHLFVTLALCTIVLTLRVIHT